MHEKSIIAIVTVIVTDFLAFVFSDTQENESQEYQIFVREFRRKIGVCVYSFLCVEKSSPEFRRRIAETDAEIKHRLETGWSSKPDVNYGISIKPLTERKVVMPKSVEKEPEEERVETEEREPIIDIFEEKDYISVIAELPGVEEKDIETKLKEDTLEISAGKYCRTIRLPSVSKSIIDRTYNNGILQLKIEREGNAS